MRIAAQTQVDHTLQFVFKWWRDWDGEFRPDRIRMQHVRAGAVAGEISCLFILPQSTDHLFKFLVVSTLEDLYQKTLCLTQRYGSVDDLVQKRLKVYKQLGQWTLQI